MYTSHLLRRSYREGGKVHHENLGNLSHLPIEVIDVIRAMLAGRQLVDLDEDFEIKRSLPHGHVAAVLGVLRELDLERLLGRERCRERDLIVAMICQRLIGPGSKLSATGALRRRRWAMSSRSARSRRPSFWRRWTGWLSAARIERTLARRHLPDEGNGARRSCFADCLELRGGSLLSLAALGYSRDGVKGKLQVNYGLICSPRGAGWRAGARGLGHRPADRSRHDRRSPRAVRDRERSVRRRPRDDHQAHASAFKAQGVDFISALKSVQIARS